MKNLFPVIFIFFSSLACGGNTESQSLLNTAHLDHLYQEVVVGNDTLGIIHIYAEYPDYAWVDDSDEGIACIDDVARAMVFYKYHFQLTGEEASLDKARKLLNFVFYMQAENGFYYNFIWPDNSINMDFKTSVAEPNWWSWRALWALAEADELFEDDPEISNRIHKQAEKLIRATEVWLDKDTTYAVYSGFELPIWLPYETASDQAAIIIKALTVYYNREKDSSVLPLMKKLAYGIKGMQAGDKETFPHYAFLSWQNTWHAWGNSQADALLGAGKVLDDSSLINAALNEVKYFYPYMIKEKFFNDFSVVKEDDMVKTERMNVYSQIAYGIRPFVLATISAYEITGDTAFAHTAAEIAGWLFGNNPGNFQMYDPETGRCFDGIVSEDEVNKNSGAESTIEALIALAMIEHNPAVKEIFDDYILRMNGNR